MALHLSGICQEPSSNLNCLIKVDDKIVKVGFSDGFLSILDDKGNVTDKLPFEYEVGRIMMKQEHVDLLKNKSNAKAVLEFNYRQLCPSTKEYTYKLGIDLDFIFQRYLIIEVFNLDKKRNAQTFGGKNGYVFDLEIPSKKISTPRMRKRKDDCL